MSKMHSDAIAYPPRGLSREESARYVGVSATKFDQMIVDQIMPKPKRIGGRVVWDRIALDMAFNTLPEDGAQEGEFFSRLFDKKKAS